MTSPYATPLILRTGHAPVPLERLPLSARGKGQLDEAWLQDVLFRNPQALPLAEIDDAFSGCVPVCRELATSAGYVDLLYVTKTGRVVVAESKLWRNPEARRTVVGQILDYARVLARWSYSDLAREVAKRTGRSGDALYEIVASAYPHVDRVVFTDGVSRCLRRGRFLLLVVGDGIREGVEGITEFLDQHASLEFTFGLVEAAIYRAPDEALLVQPRVLARSVVLSRQVVVVEGKGEVRLDGGDEGSDSEAETFQEYWREMLAGLSLDDADQPVSAPARGYNQYFGLPPNAGVAWISAYVAPAKRRCGVYLTFAVGEFAEEAYRRLASERQEIDAELGEPVRWVERGGGKFMIEKVVEDIEPLQDDQRPAAHGFFRDWVNRFVNAFRPRLESIVRDLEGD